VEIIAPQHGRAYVGRRAVSEFLDWLERLECGVDLFTQDSYRVPAAGG
jgi:flavorubredoxin